MTKRSATFTFNPHSCGTHIDDAMTPILTQLFESSGYRLDFHVSNLDIASGNEERVTIHGGCSGQLGLHVPVLVPGEKKRTYAICISPIDSEVDIADVRVAVVRQLQATGNPEPVRENGDDRRSDPSGLQGSAGSRPRGEGSDEKKDDARLFKAIFKRNSCAQKPDAFSKIVKAVLDLDGWPNRKRVKKLEKDPRLCKADKVGTTRRWHLGEKARALVEQELDISLDLQEQLGTVDSSSVPVIVPEMSFEERMAKLEELRAKERGVLTAMHQLNMEIGRLLEEAREKQTRIASLKSNLKEVDGEIAAHKRVITK